jgi:predicted DNA-binding transcriptional regulator YafY
MDGRILSGSCSFFEHSASLCNAAAERFSHQKPACRLTTHPHFLAFTIMDNKDRRLIFLDQLFRGALKYSLADILQMIEEKELGTKGGGISERTFHSDRKELENLTEGVVECIEEEGEKRYGYKRPVPEPLERFHIDKQQMQALYLAKEALENTQGIPESKDIGNAIKNLEYMIADAGQQVFRPNVGRVVRFARSPMKAVDPTIWKTVYEAIDERKKITLHYKKGWKKAEAGKRYHLIPLCIVNLEGEWYLLANTDTKEEDVRQFHLSRVTKAEKKGPYKHLPDGLDIDAYLANNFGRFIGDPYDLVDITLRFSPKVYPIVTGHRYHPKQQAVQLENGGLKITFPVTAFGVDPSWRFYHVRSWILSFGEDCEVLEPQDLKDLVRGDLERALKRAQDTDKS